MAIPNNRGGKFVSRNKKEMEICRYCNSTHPEGLFFACQRQLLLVSDVLAVDSGNLPRYGIIHREVHHIQPMIATGTRGTLLVYKCGLVKGYQDYNSICNIKPTKCNLSLEAVTTGVVIETALS